MNAELKTKLTEANVDEFIDSIEIEVVRNDCRQIIELMQNATNAPPKMWGASIVGFGDRHLIYPSGRELDWMKIGFSPRKANITLYLNLGCARDGAMLEKLGKYKTGKGCLYIKKLSDINIEILKELITKSAKAAK